MKLVEPLKHECPRVYRRGGSGQPFRLLEPLEHECPRVYRRGGSGELFLLLEPFNHEDKELCIGDELFEKMIEEGYFTEVQTAIIMQQMGLAISGALENGVRRRDLKPEEFLFQTKKVGEKNFLKVTGPGLSYVLAPGQVLVGKKTQSSEHWHCSVLTHQRLDSHAPQIRAYAKRVWQTSGYSVYFYCLIHAKAKGVRGAGAWRRCVAQVRGAGIGARLRSFEPCLRAATFESPPPSRPFESLLRASGERCDVCAGDREQRSDVCAGDREQRTPERK